MFKGCFLKYKIWKISIEFPKNKAKLRPEKLSSFKVKLKELEQNLNNDKAKEQYNAYRGDVIEIYDEITNGIKVRRKCDWYKFGEKSKKFFLKLMKHDISDVDKRCNPTLIQLYKSL